MRELPELGAYHHSEIEKQDILATLAAHRAADKLVQGYGYWRDGKGCAVGCTLHSGYHAEYVPRFGIPENLARLEDAIFEGLPVDLARQWPERFMSAIAPGADLSLIQWHFLHALLSREDLNPGITHPTVAGPVAAVAALIAILATGGTVQAATLTAARRAAEIAAKHAGKDNAAANAAANAAEGAAEDTAEGAACHAAWSTAWATPNRTDDAAWGAAEKAAWTRQADLLIGLLKIAPIH